MISFLNVHTIRRIACRSCGTKKNVELRVWGRIESLRNPIQSSTEYKWRSKVLQFVCLTMKMKFHWVSVSLCYSYRAAELRSKLVYSNLKHTRTSNHNKCVLSWGIERRQKAKAHTISLLILFCYLSCKSKKAFSTDDVWENWRIVLDNLMSVSKEIYIFSPLSVVVDTHSMDCTYFSYA